MKGDIVYAYFVGGPEDLSKKVLNEPMSFIRVASIPSLAFCHSPDLAPERASLVTHLYRAVSRVEPEGSSVTTIIYEYRGEEE